MCLLGADREKRFIKYSLERPKPSTEAELCMEQAEWDGLKEFLEKERALRERYVLLQKSKESFGLSSSNMQHDGHRTANTGQLDGLPCHLCDKTDHVTSTDFFGRKSIDYFSCKMFVDMTPTERMTELMKQKFCLQCLRPGMRFDATHKMSRYLLLP